MAIRDDARSGTGDGGDRSDGASPLVDIAKDIVIGVGVVVLLVLVFFLISGVWPPFVAIETGSMEPHMAAGDLVYLVEPDRYSSFEGPGNTNLVTLETGTATGHLAFGKPGHVVVFRPDDSDRTPIIHRLHFWVDANEDWYDRADPDYVRDYEDCDEMPNCPAPHAGFITKGDDNNAYDQIEGQSGVVRPEWIEGRAVVRVPYLGYLRLNLF